MVVCQKYVMLKSPKRAFEVDERGLPVLDDLKVSDNLIEVLEPFPLIILLYRTCSIVDLKFVLVDHRNEDNCDYMSSAIFPPLLKECW